MIDIVDKSDSTNNKVETTTIRVSSILKNELNLCGRKGESYEDIIKRNINFTKKFTNEREFRGWFKENYLLLGFDDIIEDNKNKTPDFIMLKDGEKVKVELETFSSNFILHGHKKEDVDVVICLLKDKDIEVHTVEINMFTPTHHVKVSIERDVVNILKSRLIVGETYSSLLRKILKE